MHRIDADGTSAALPTPSPVGSTVGYFTEGNPGSGLAATAVSADWLNAVQEELVYLIQQAGLTLDKASRTQIHAAVLALAAGAAAGGLLKTGGTMSGVLNMGAQLITNLANPASAQDASSKSYVDAIMPYGTILPFGGVSIPTGFVACDGSSILRSAKPLLFAAIGTIHGAADGTHFNLPDYRGRFLRGYDGTAGRDPDKLTRTAAATGGATGNNVGSVQDDQVKAHTHGISFNVWTDQTRGGAPVSTTFTPQAVPPAAGTASWVTDASTGTESRPKNAFVNYMIRSD